MRVVFMGSPEFAVPALQALNAAHEVVAVYTQPDKVRRRGRKLVPTAVKQAALELGLEVLEPRSLRDADEIERLSAMAPDVICVAAFGMILPSEVLAIPAQGCVNVHASLLPRHRGAAPIHRAI
ncbi:MAG: methionyl-tRNA formyltransferase, partial [Coriobacteriia bacterium]|nr:methionyl-tRNA formyltransferase [Coriobacteriia bacterium]